MVDKIPNLRAAGAEFASYIAEKIRYVSITEQQGPLRPGESQLRGPRRQYIRTRMEWDPQKACWMNRDGRPLITRDLIWETIIKEMRQLDSYGQRKVWSIVKAKYDGIQEDDVRAVCKAWSDHNLDLLNPQDNSLWDLNPEALTNTIKPFAPLSANSAGLGRSGNMHLEDHLSPGTRAAIIPSSSQLRSHDRQELFEGSILEQDSCQTNDSPSAESQPNHRLLEDRLEVDDDPSNHLPEQEGTNQTDTQRVAPEATHRASRSGCQRLLSVSIPQRSQVMPKVTRKPLRRKTSSEKLQKYTENLMENYAKRPNRQAKTNVERLRGVGAGIYASNVESFAQEAAERVSRTNELTDFVEKIDVRPSKRGQRMRSKSKLRLPSPIEDAGNSNDDEENDEDDDEDEDEDEDDDGDLEIQNRLEREKQELYAKHMRLGTHYGAVSAYQQSYGPMRT